MKRWTIAGSVLLAALAVNFGWPWVALGIHASNVRDHLAAIVGSSPQPRLVLVDVSTPSKPHILRSIFPGPHFSGLIGASHNGSYKIGSRASRTST